MYEIWKLYVENYLSYRIRSKVLTKFRCDLDLWPFDPKIYRRLSFPILYLCMKYKVCRLRDCWVIALQQSVDRQSWQNSVVTLTFDLWTPKPIGVFLSLSSICVWSMKFVGWEIFELSHYNKVWTDRQTDRQSDYYRAPASSMAGP